ncbi:lipopolysaccharide transport periplasmic protein LptA [Luteimonas soli]|uniref:Lipopolysaccharide transport periplasmic protein LptA n=1 Tax=Luteimonas soli TaxID=1648966 RepID=A0ABV7XMK5_9GAMM
MNRRAASTLPLLAALACVVAGGAWAKSSDRNQRMNVTANSSDCSVDESKPCILSGNVHITQGTLDIQSAKADVRRGGGQQVIKLTGSPVKMKQQMDDGGWMNATAAQIDYDQNRDTVVFSGNAVVKQPGRGSISGERIVYNMATGQVQSGAAAGGGRVNMTFEPKNKAPAGADNKAGDAEPPKQDDE